MSAIFVSAPPSMRQYRETVPSPILGTPVLVTSVFSVTLPPADRKYAPPFSRGSAPPSAACAESDTEKRGSVPICRVAVRDITVCTAALWGEPLGREVTTQRYLSPSIACAALFTSYEALFAPGMSCHEPR